MLKTIRTVTILSSLLLPIMSFGATEGDAKSDQKLLAKIQKSLAKDDSLRADAGNVKVIVEGGVVTLKGMTSSDERREDIQARAESEAIQVTPIDHIHTVIVHNELTVTPSN